MASTAPLRRNVRLGAGGGNSVTYTLPQDTAFRVETVSFTLDNTGGGAAANPAVIYKDQAGITIFAQVVGTALAAGATMIYTASPWGDPCGSGQTSIGNVTPDTIGGITLVEGCQIRVEAADTTSGAGVAGAKITSPFAWVEPLTGASDIDAVPLLTPLAPDEQLVA